ncbi:hypothetical protein PN836_008620 [Ningiella sp. W23]|uniref:hypothetical protein n=1 Tax=Ningiella sp. W23 TaxID=3023715 RepID=UPI0037584723
MKKSIIAVGLALAFSGSAMANIVMSGNFVQTQISEDGTLGDGGADPGLVYDSTGSGTFDPNFDYVAPGIPFEAFGIRYDGSGLLENSNSQSNGSVGGGDDFSFTSLTDVSATSSFDNHVEWAGTNGVLDITHDFFFNDDDERVSIVTQITALSDVTGLLFSRAVDPDPDSRSSGTAVTNNQRGIDVNTDGDLLDPEDISVNQFVGSLGSVSGAPLGLFAQTDFIQNTGLSGACCSTIDPSFYLGGGSLGDSSTGDHGIGIAFELGDLLAGDSISVAYAYVMGLSLDTIDIGDDPDPVSAPGAFALMMLSLGAIFGRRKFRK